MGNATSCDSCASNIDCTPVINFEIPGVYTGMDETNAPDSKQHYWERKPFKAKSFHECPDPILPEENGDVSLELPRKRSNTGPSPRAPTLFPEQNDQHLSVQQAEMIIDHRGSTRNSWYRERKNYEDLFKRTPDSRERRSAERRSAIAPILEPDGSCSSMSHKQLPNEMIGKELRGGWQGSVWVLNRDLSMQLAREVSNAASAELPDEQEHLSGVASSFPAVPPSLLREQNEQRSNLSMQQDAEELAAQKRMEYERLREEMNREMLLLEAKIKQQVSDTNSARLDHFRMLRRDLDAAMTCFISAKKEERERANQAKAHAAALTAAQQVERQICIHVLAAEAAEKAHFENDANKVDASKSKMERLRYLLQDGMPATPVVTEFGEPGSHYLTSPGVSFVALRRVRGAC